MSRHFGETGMVSCLMVTLLGSANDVAAKALVEKLDLRVKFVTDGDANQM